MVGIVAGRLILNPAEDSNPATGNNPSALDDGNKGGGQIKGGS